MKHFILSPDKQHPDKIDQGKGPVPSAEIPDALPSSYEQEVNTSEGGEFLDDGIRMKDQPLGETNTKEKE
jgi:hypothetical protein